ncbi:MAG: hypothetical protein WC442_05750 [Candidatus Omnitrophota bacterium]|jgi:hypothetical protein
MANNPGFLKEMSQKVSYIFKEMFYMIKRQKLYFMIPTLTLLALLAFLVYYIGPAVVISFIYAGI